MTRHTHRSASVSADSMALYKFDFMLCYVSTKNIKTRPAGPAWHQCTYDCPYKTHKIFKNSYKTTTNV